MKQGPEFETHGHRHRRLRRRMVDQVGQAGRVECFSVDRQLDPRTVVAVAVQRSGKAVEVLACTLGQRETTDRRGFLQRDKTGRVVQRLVQQGVAGGGERDVVRLRVGGEADAGHRSDQKRCK